MRTHLLTAAVALAAAMIFTPAIASTGPADTPIARCAADGIAMGTITSVDQAKSTFVLELADGQELSIMFNDDTKVTVNGNEATREALRDDAKAAVTHDKGVAKSVAITSE